MATCPTFEAFLLDIFRGDNTLVEWMQRCLGYTITGLTIEHKAWFLTGAGFNGKSTLVGAVGRLLGENQFYIDTPASTFTAGRYENHPTDLARLAGVRMTTVSEGRGTKRIDEEKFKKITGNDMMSARFMHQDSFGFQPQCKLWFAMNTLPSVDDYTDAFLGRVYVVPFFNQYYLPGIEDKRDKDLPAKLDAEASGILNWLIRGCLNYLDHGLNDAPPVVVMATSSYRSQEDIVARYVGECIDFPQNTADEDWKIPSSSLFADFKLWCDQNGEYAGKNKTFSLTLERKGLTKKRTGKGVVWVGVAFKPNAPSLHP